MISHLVVGPTTTIPLRHEQYHCITVAKSLPTDAVVPIGVSLVTTLAHTSGINAERVLAASRSGREVPHVCSRQLARDVMKQAVCWKRVAWLESFVLMPKEILIRMLLQLEFTQGLNNDSWSKTIAFCAELRSL